MLVAPDGRYVEAGAAENLAPPTCQDFHRGLVAAAFDENDLVRLGGGQIDAHPGSVHRVNAVGRR
jgi:hypothetical protein